MELASNREGVPASVQSDEALWLRSLNGDGEAFGLLFDRHHGRVFGHACRLTRTRHDAEDVVASAFLELWRRRTDVRLVNQSVLPWLLVTATNCARNTARATRRYRQFLERLPRAPEQPTSAETDALGVDPRVREALRTLNRTDAHLVVLIALEGYPVTAAAQQLGLSVPATRARLHRLRTKLRDQLGDLFPDGGPNDQRGER